VLVSSALPCNAACAHCYDSRQKVAHATLLHVFTTLSRLTILLHGMKHTVLFVDDVPDMPLSILGLNMLQYAYYTYYNPN